MCTVDELIGIEINYESEEYGSIGYPTVISIKFTEFLLNVDIKVVSIELIAGMRAVFISKFEALGITMVIKEL